MKEIKNHNVEPPDEERLIAYDGVKKLAISLLPVEEQMVVNAFTDGQIEIINTVVDELKLEWELPKDDKEDGQKYFNNNFKTD